MRKAPPVVLSVAGSDPSGGAGIQADLKTFAALEVFGAAAVTAITVQNTLGVTRVVPLDPALVADQIDAVATDLDVVALKIGMLANAGIVAAVADCIRRHRFGFVVADTLIRSSSGANLLDEDGVRIFRERILPLATVITPNVTEAAELSGMDVRTIDDARAAARRLVAIGAKAAIVTGGHLTGREAIDVLFDGRELVDVRAERIDSRHTHGTGCVFSSALAARLALGDGLATAARSAKAFVTRAITNAPGLGGGRGPLGIA